MQKGDAAYIKKMNKRLVLQCIRDHAPLSRSEISKRLNISKPSVSQLVEVLLAEGWILETGQGASTISGGRKPVQLVFNAKAAYIIGVDIGGTKVASGITGLDGRVYAYREFATQEHLQHDLFKRLQEDVLLMMTELNIQESDILGMGIGVPGVTNVEDGTVIEAPSLSWKAYPVREKAAVYFPYPIMVENDVNTSVLGEHWLGKGRGKENLIYIAVGTGIGSGMVLNGTLYRGSNQSAGEMGYLVTNVQQAKTYHPTFQGYGFLESIASGSSIGEQLSDLKGKPLTAKDAFRMRQEGDLEATRVVDIAVEHLAFGIANYVSLFDPELVILGGGVGGAFSDLEQSLVDVLNRYTPNGCPVVPSAFGKEAGVVGAVALFLKECDSIIQL